MSENGKPLRLEWRTPAELADNPDNWRRHPDGQTAALEGVIADVGWAGAALFNERTGRLIDGHARKKVASGLLVDGKLPVLVGSWSEAEERTILATLDPLAAMAEADTDKLAELLAGLETENEAVDAMLRELASVTLQKGENDADAEWQGMPEYENEDQTAFQSIHVHFKSQQAVDEFARNIGQSITPKTRATWYPAIEIEIYADKQYADES